MNEYCGKKILIIGLARSGLAAVKLLLKLGAEVTVSEAKKPEQIAEYDWLISHGVSVRDQSPAVFEEDYDEAVKNPGINGNLPFIRRLRERGIPVITEIELAFRAAAPQHYVAVTGTNGKTTTCSLLYEVLERAFPGQTLLCGNIGVALCETVLEQNLLERSGRYVVLEISNFQLVDIVNFRPEISVIINLAPDHVDFMGSEDAYYRSKTRVYENMRADDIYLKNIDDALIKEYTEKIPVNCRQITYSLEDASADFYADDEYIYEHGQKLIALSDVRVVGRHNVQNVLVSAAAACMLGADRERIREAVAAFRGVEHRIEYVREKDGVKYYNDSKGTNVDATITAVRAFKAPTILLAGGFEKGLSFEPLKPYMTNVKAVIAFGACGKRLSDELTGGAAEVVNDLEQALAKAVEIAVPGDVVLLSPTTSSFDQYSCFEERGDHFKKLVNEL